jgi:hypothetical protein
MGSRDERVLPGVDRKEDGHYNEIRTNPEGAMAGEKKEKSARAEQAEEKLKEGLRRIFEATKELSKEVIEGFKEGYGGGKKDK